ncbi:MAG: CBS domain-containing protein [Pseudomonadota bacterium]|nr:CBS domain-containing protein [Pseudomonadota bacterium]
MPGIDGRHIIMNLEQILIPTKVAKPGMIVSEVFAECIRANIPGIPFCDAQGHIRGRVTLKNVLKNSCLPEYLVELARVLGDQLSCMEDMEAKAKQLMNNPIDPYILEPHISLTSDSPAIKALALMERNDTSYIFVVDEGQYKGVITIQGLARMLTQLDERH